MYLLRQLQCHEANHRLFFNTLSLNNYVGNVLLKNVCFQTLCTMALRTAALRLLSSQKCALVTASRAQGTAVAAQEGMPLTSKIITVNEELYN